MCCAVFQQGTTEQTPDSTRCSSSDGTKIPVHRALLWCLSLPWGHCGVGAPQGQPRPVLGNAQRCWSQQGHTGLSQGKDNPSALPVPVQNTPHGITARPQTPPFTSGSLFLLAGGFLLPAACSGAWKTTAARQAWPCWHCAAPCSNQSPPSTVPALVSHIHCHT